MVTRQLMAGELQANTRFLAAKHHAYLATCKVTEYHVFIYWWDYLLLLWQLFYTSWNTKVALRIYLMKSEIE